MNNLIIYGGSFDPVHNGHLNTAINVQKKFNFEHFYFLPCKIPVLKNETHASAEHRLNMIKLAVADLPENLNFQVDCTEIDRNTPSYMVITLEHFREKMGDDCAITLLLGYDSFCQLPSWYQWEKLFELANIMVINRPGFSKQELPPLLQSLISRHENNNDTLILRQAKGLIHFFDAGSYDISSTKLRKLLLQGGEEIKEEIPEKVMLYIRENALYSIP